MLDPVVDLVEVVHGDDTQHPVVFDQQHPGVDQPALDGGAGPPGTRSQGGRVTGTFTVPQRSS